MMVMHGHCIVLAWSASFKNQEMWISPLIDIQGGLSSVTGSGLISCSILIGAYATGFLKVLLTCFIGLDWQLAVHILVEECTSP